MKKLPCLFFVVVAAVAAAPVLGHHSFSMSTERLYLDPKNRDLLHLEFTFADPKVLAEPWRRTHMFRRDRTWEQIEYICVQNNRHQIDETGQTVVPR